MPVSAARPAGVAAQRSGCTAPSSGDRGKSEATSLMKMAASGKSKSPAMDGLVKQFAAITGATEDVGRRLLEVCNGNLEMAIGMQLEGAVETAEAGASAGPSGASAGPSGGSAVPEIPPDDSVRAPIPQKREIMVPEVPTFGPRPRRRGGQMSIFDKFRDFQAETRHQEALIRNQGNEIPQSAKIRTLEDLFRPPVDLMHKGTFNTAREAGQSQGRWLIVNVQDVQEFNCQKLNRDVWSDPTVRSIIRESFIFWQVYHDSDEGRRYMQFYRVNEFPYVSILDPRTGELLVSWMKLDSVSFCDLVMEFLSDHPCFDKDTLSSPPAKRARTTKSILDASEDSQLEAAIAASLAESSSSASQSAQPTKDSSAAASSYKKTPETISLSGDEDDEDEIEDDDDDLIVNVESNSSRDSSDSDCVVESVGDHSSKKVPPTNPSSLSQNSLRAAPSHVEKTEHLLSSLNGNAIAEKEGRTKTVNQNSNGDNHGGGSDKDVKRKVSNALDGITENRTEMAETSLNNGKTEVDAEEQSQAKLMLRFPDGKRKQLSLSEDTPLLTLVKLVGKEGYANERYEMVTNFPRRKLSYMDFDKSLKEAGLCPQETIFIQER
ncbi:UBX domain-containing protein 7-like [Patiria miniata]|uniref:UBX domain-containing protein n=1 Tax=Patiria miniata TaxID=46514 RepID=A0A913ZGM7_PATMI|nr:UBX domain-containing protein 7-like [Patiria miniata]